MSELKDDFLMNFIKSFSETISKENIEFFKKIVADKEIDGIKTPQDFFYKFTYDFEKFSNGLLREKVSTNNEIIFLFSKYSFIKNQISNLFEKFEGSTCCEDKTKVVVNSLFDFFKTGNEIEFNYEQEYTYHLPKKILKTHEDIAQYYSAIKSLYYGKPGDYLTFLLKLNKNGTEE